MDDNYGGFITFFSLLFSDNSSATKHRSIIYEFTNIVYLHF